MHSVARIARKHNDQMRSGMTRENITLDNRRSEECETVDSPLHGRPQGRGRVRVAHFGRSSNSKRSRCHRTCAPKVNLATLFSWGRRRDRKSTRLNSSHSQISYAVFCLKKKKNKPTTEFLNHTKSI